MASHPNRRRPTVHLDADWTIYTDALPKGSVALGTITLGDETGALVQIDDDYLMIRARGLHKLNTRKVRAAIEQAQTAIPQTEAGDSDRD